MLWQTNRIKHQRPRNKQRLQLLHLVPADQVVADKAGMAVTVDMAVVVDVAKADQVVAAGADAVKVVDREDRAAVPVDLAAANGNFFARKKSASSASKRWI
jgi:cyanophycinase-like exopeptidase